MLKPLSATKGEIFHKLLFIPFVGIVGSILASVVWAVASIEIVGPQGTPSTLGDQFMSIPKRVESDTNTAVKPKILKPTQTAVPTQTKQKTYRNQPVFIPPPTPKSPYPVCVIYYPTLNMTETYTTFSPTECSNEKAKAASYLPYPTIPNISQDALNQLNHINDNLQNITIVEHTPTPNPCSSLQGSAQIVGGSCN